VVDQASIDRLRQTDTNGFPVLSIFVNLEPGPESLRNVPATIKDLLAQVDEASMGFSHAQAMSVREDLQAVSSRIGRFGTDLGRSIAIFRSSGAGLDEQLSLPGPVRDRAILDTAPYLRPLEAMLEHYQRFCVAVVGRRIASIFRFAMGRLETWEEMRDEEVRKANYGGFSGYEEHRVRARSDELTARHYRHVGARLAELQRSEDGFDLLIVGGSDSHVAGTVAALPPDVAGRLAGSFAIDPRTMTPAIVLDHAQRVAAAWEQQREQKLVADLVDTAASGGDAVLGLESVCDAVNQRAVEVLVIQIGRAVPGFACAECGWVSCATDNECRVCGSELQRVPDLVDRLSDSVRASGGTVQHVLSDSPLADIEVGARLRYSLAMVDPT
jgi:peptide subunit release factor 1 (eRF1)